METISLIVVMICLFEIFLLFKQVKFQKKMNLKLIKQIKKNE